MSSGAPDYYASRLAAAVEQRPEATAGIGSNLPKVLDGQPRWLLPPGADRLPRYRDHPNKEIVVARYARVLESLHEFAMATCLDVKKKEKRQLGDIQYAPSRRRHLGKMMDLLSGTVAVGELGSIRVETIDPQEVPSVAVAQAIVSRNELKAEHAERGQVYVAVFAQRYIRGKGDTLAGFLAVVYSGMFGATQEVGYTGATFSPKILEKCADLAASPGGDIFAVVPEEGEIV